MADVHELDLFSAKVTVLFVDATWRRGGQRTPSCAIFSSTLGLGTGVDRSISLFSGPQVLRHEITGSDWKAIEASRGFTSLALSRLLMQCVCGQKKLRFRPSTANRTSAMKSSENRTAAHDVCTRLRNPVVRVLFACSHYRVAVWKVDVSPRPTIRSTEWCTTSVTRQKWMALSGSTSSWKSDRQLMSAGVASTLTTFSRTFGKTANFNSDSRTFFLERSKCSNYAITYSGHTNY